MVTHGMGYTQPMPWPPEQMRAIAARMHDEGKSEAEIRAFFHRHGHPHRQNRKKRHKAAAKRGAHGKRR